MHIDILLEGDHDETINRQLHRYARALWEVLFGNQIDLVGNVVAAISLRPVDGMATDIVKDPQSNMLFRGWRWIFEVHRYDDLT